MEARKEIKDEGGRRSSSRQQQQQRGGQVREGGSCTWPSLHLLQREREKTLLSLPYPPL